MAKEIYVASLVIIQLAVTYIKPQKRQERIWKPVKRNQILSPLEICILKNLVENNSQTINETAKAINKQYKSTFRIFTSLKKKGIIKKTTFKEHRGRKYPRYWVTELGIFTALLEGANPTTLLEKTRDIYSENKGLQCLIETSRILGIDAYEMAYHILLSKGKLEQSDYNMIFATQLLKEQTPDQISQLFTILQEKYPEYYRQVKENLEQFGINLQRTLEALH